MIAAVTGANGYVGSITVDALTAAGFSVRRLVRRPEMGTDCRYDIAEACSPATLDGVDVLVHCAYDMSLTARADIWRTNVLGTRKLLEAANLAAVRRTIVVSSMSAYAGTTQLYGRAKLASEIDAFARGMCAVRLGLVYGPGGGGMAGTLRKLASLPIVPVVARRSYQFTLHEDDLRQAVAAIATAGELPTPLLGLANPEPVPFDQLLHGLGERRNGRNAYLIPLPWRALYWPIRAAEAARIGLPLRADSLLGLVRPAPSVPNVECLSQLGLAPRAFAA